jgi:hypothetical protein
MSEQVDEGRTADQDRSNGSRWSGTWARRKRHRNSGTDLGQLERRSFDRRGGEVQEGSGPVVGIERERMRMLLLVTMMVFGDLDWTVGVVVPVVEVVDEREGVESEQPGESRRTRPETLTSPGHSGIPFADSATGGWILRKCTHSKI